jgi:uncharacterized protein DUF6457
VKALVPVALFRVGMGAMVETASGTRGGGAGMEEWLRRLAVAVGVDPIDADQMETLLGVARDVAHGVERKATPLATFLLGAAVQRRINHGATAQDALADALVDLRTVLPAADD